MTNAEIGATVPHVTNGQAPPSNQPEKRNILGVDVSAYTRQSALAHINRLVSSGAHAKICFLNAHGANIAWNDPAYRQDLAKFDVLADGIGVDVGSLINHRRKFPDNLNGTDFMPAVLEHLSASRIALLGAAPGVAELAVENMRQLYPHHQFTIVGHGFFDAAGEAEIVNRLQRIAPDVLLVALGNPAQEKWIAKNCNRNNCIVAIGVGAYFDFVAGRVPRAPELLRQLRLEWVYRLWLEPARMWKRYIIGNPLFVLRSIIQKLGGGRRS